MNAAGELRHALPKTIAGVIFDCDGVLIDSRAANTAYYNRIRALAGLPPMNADEEDYAHMHSSRESLLHVMPPHLHGRLREFSVPVSYEREIMPMIRPEPDLHDCLNSLQAYGLRLAVLTNRAGGMRLVLDAFALHPYFDPVMTAADVAPKPSPEGLIRIAEVWNRPPADLVFVGDSLLDARAAEAAGVCFVAFRNSGLKAHGYVNSLAELKCACMEFSLEI